MPTTHVVDRTLCGPREMRGLLRNASGGVEQGAFARDGFALTICALAQVTR